LLFFLLSTISTYETLFRFGGLMSDRTHFVPVETIRSLIKDVFMKAGVPEDDAETCSDVLIESDIRGIESHGISRLKYYYKRFETGQHQAVTNFEVVNDTPTTAVIDGHHGMGMVIGKRAMQMAIDKAKLFGLGCVTVRNSTHFGIAGYYPTMAANQDMIGLTVTNTRPSVSPTFGVEPMLGTNPIAFGAPTDEEFPFIFDGATPISQRGKIEVLARAGKKIPVGWVINEINQPIEDSPLGLEALEKRTASFLPLGGAGETLSGHKGYGLGTMVEILSASLQSGAFLQGLTGIGPDGHPQPFKVGHFFLAINIEFFTTIDNFKQITGNILRDLRNSKKAPGQPRIFTAGEKEYEMSKITKSRGIPINLNLQKEIKYLVEKLGPNQYDFPF
jgi:LDH2 family malate/lactate/ureidoglycolate dehydrogenase